MIKILYYFIIISSRKLLSRGDKFGFFLLICLYYGFSVLIFMNYTQIKGCILFFFISPLVYHINRDDIELLKTYKNYKVLVLTEYFIYCLPFYMILLLKKEWQIFSIVFIFYAFLINFPKIKFYLFSYPFKLFNPFWHICFRKSKLILFLFLAIGLIFISVCYKNENLIYFAFFMIVLIACNPNFEREEIEFIKINPQCAKKYLNAQLKNTIINTTFLLIPVFIVMVYLSKFNLILYLVFVLFVPLINILLKYSCFNNPLLQQFGLALFVGFLNYGFPILLIPFLYHKAVITLKTIKYANY
jgi:hypothetical protein